MGIGYKMKLSNRETEILELISRGFTDKEIAVMLKISPRTVQTHVTRTVLKFDARNRTHAVTLFLMKSLNIPSFGRLVNT